MPGRYHHYGCAKSLRGAPKRPNNVISTFFNTVAFERPQAPSNLVTLLRVCSA